MLRVDIFSAKGGVGKTTVAYRLAKESSKNGTVLLIDADLTGTCLGDLIEPRVDIGWSEQYNLTHLICGGPEHLPELLGKEKIPVYEIGATSGSSAKRVDAKVAINALLFCPSHPETYVDIDGKYETVNPAVLHALLGHESAGGWVRYVIEQIINATDTLLVGKSEMVIVDHGPGIGALQWAELCAIEKEHKEALAEKRASMRLALFVTSRDVVDLATCKAIDERMRTARMQIADRAVWVINRVPTSDRTLWRKPIEADLGHSGIGPAITDRWFAEAVPLFEEPNLALAYAKSDLVSYCESAHDEPMTGICSRLRSLSSTPASTVSV